MPERGFCAMTGPLDFMIKSDEMVLSLERQFQTGKMKRIAGRLGLASEKADARRVIGIGTPKRGTAICDRCRRTFNLWRTRNDIWDRLPGKWRGMRLCIPCFKELSGYSPSYTTMHHRVMPFGVLSTARPWRDDRP